MHEHASCHYNVFAPSGLTNQPQSYSLVELMNSTSILIFVLTEHRIILFINLAPQALYCLLHKNLGKHFEVEYFEYSPYMGINWLS